MKQTTQTNDAEKAIPILPKWILNCEPQKTAENSAFKSGAVLALLYTMLKDPTINVPAQLLRQRLALRAATHCLKLQGRTDMEWEIRDAFHLSQPNGPMGPAGDMLAFWKRGIGRMIGGHDWVDKVVLILPEVMHEDARIAVQGETTGLKECSPVTRISKCLHRMLEACPQYEVETLLIGDALLARLLGWERPLPLIALALERPAIRSLHNHGNKTQFEVACHNAVAMGARVAVRLAYDLARRAKTLRAVAPRLRAKGSDDAVALFLSQDAVFPSTMLSPTIAGTQTKMSAQSARRLCARLVELGVARELTGRVSFRLYGV